MSDTTRLRLTANQLATMLVLDGAIAHLQTCANQLGGFLKLKDEAEILMGAVEYIGTRKMAMQKQWDGSIVVVQPGDVSRVALP